MWGAIAGAVAQTGVDMYMQNRADQKNHDAAKAQMKFQKDMSDTAHQREVRDLRAAGLNPILSANAGASTPGGASYTAQSADSTGIDPLLPSQLKQARAAVDNTIADTGLKAANTKSAEKSLEIAEQQRKLLQAQTAKEGEQARISRQTADLQDRYGEASQIMGLINSGTGSVGNLMGIGNLLKGFLKPNQNTIHERYSPSGEHMGTTHKRTYRD